MINLRYTIRPPTDVWEIYYDHKLRLYKLFLHAIRKLKDYTILSSTFIRQNNTLISFFDLLYLHDLNSLRTQKDVDNKLGVALQLIRIIMVHIYLHFVKSDKNVTFWKQIKSNCNFINVHLCFNNDDVSCYRLITIWIAISCDHQCV